ncbi:S41 family peptidase [bacterium]|nr:S41 family peptidase [bacterium]
MKKRIILVVLVLFSCLLVHSCVPSRGEDVWEHSFEKVSNLVSLVEDHYYQEVDKKKLANSSIKGILATLDPHSHFLDLKNLARLREEYKGKYHGLGIMIQKQEERLVVISPIEGTPASRKGIQAGDVISHINGESTKPITSHQAMMKLRGPEGTKVNITIVREGLEEPREMTIKREEIPLHSVPYSFMLKEDVGYIFIRNFAKTTTQEFEDKMSQLKEKGMEKLILDMRGNGGGTFAQSVELADEFLPKGALVVSIKGRNKKYDQEFKAHRNDQYENLPLIILINHGTASAPEIVSGAIKDHDRGLIVGDDSWGKGLVQTVFPVGSDAAVALTTAKYYTPSGRSIQRDYTHIEDYFYSEKVPEEEREVSYTKSGRQVLGQGGISPDYKVEMSYKRLAAKLLLKGVYFSYAQKFAQKQTPLAQKLAFSTEKSTQENRPQDQRIVDKNFRVGSQVLSDFKSYLKKEDISFKEEAFSQAQKQIKRELEKEIYSALWGMEEGIKVYRKSDPVVLKALEIFPQAVSVIENQP